MSKQMAVNAIRTWEKAIKLLQDGTKDPASSAQHEVYTVTVDILTKLYELPPLTKLTWKKLVQQMQVRTAAVTQFGNLATGSMFPATVRAARTWCLSPASHKPVTTTTTTTVSVSTASHC